MLQPLDGPASHGILSVSDSVVSEVKVGASPLDERKVVTIQPDDKIYIYFGDGLSTPSAGTVSTNGILIFKNAIHSFEASRTQPIFILSVSSTINVKIIERA